MQSVSSDYFDYYFGWENSRLRYRRLSVSHTVPYAGVPDCLSLTAPEIA